MCFCKVVFLYIILQTQQIVNTHYSYKHTCVRGVVWCVVECEKGKQREDRRQQEKRVRENIWQA